MSEQAEFDFWDLETIAVRGGSKVGETPRAPKANYGQAAAGVLKFAAPFLGQLVEKFLGKDPGAEILQELKIREACVRLKKLQDGGVAPIRLGELEALGNISVGEDGKPVWGRQDMLVFGVRGSGKSVFCARAGEIALACGQTVRSCGFPDATAAELGFEPYDGPLDKLEDCVVIVEEAGLAYAAGKKKDEALERALALARHNNVSLIWNAQNMAQMQKGILRHEALLVFKRIDPFARLFEREEVAPIMEALVAIQTQHPAEGPSQTVILDGGKWVLTDTPLPTIWNQDLSKMHRNRS